MQILATPNKDKMTFKVMQVSRVLIQTNSHVRVHEEGWGNNENATRLD